MEQLCFNHIEYQLAHWQVADVRTVPGVMVQVRCGANENDHSIEYQINWFIDCTETYVHNHRHSFDTFCLEGQYLEKLWEIVDEHSDATTFRILRSSGNIFDLPERVPGALCHIKSRNHFPGNQIHVGTHQFHSIAPVDTSTERVLTFLVKKKHLPTPDMFVLSSSPDIDAPKEEIRSATEAERQSMHDKLRQVLGKRLRQDE